MKYQLILKRFNLDINIVKNKINLASKGNFSQDLITKRLVFEGNLDINKTLKLNEIDNILIEEKAKTKLQFKILRDDLLKISKKFNQINLKVKLLSSIKLAVSSLENKLSNFLKKNSININENSENPILVELFKEGGQVFYRIFSSKNKEIIEDKSKFKNITVLIENPRLKEEISDFLRLSLIFNLTFKVIHNDKVQFEAILKNAKRETKGKLGNFKVEIINDLDELKGYIKIGFSKHAKLNEQDLIKFLRENKNKKLLFVFGNDIFGLTQETRDKLQYIYRLTPEKIKPLKAGQALSYVLGIYSTLS